ncbi:MAG: chemotaxis-specific protein-glutamate methyltransferase CheB [Chloroflexota bacterium]
MADRFPIRVLLAEDSPTIRHYLTQVINEIPGLKVVGAARDGAEAVEMAETLKPDVISMDIRMPGVDGLEATRRIMSQNPVPIVMVSGLLDDEMELSFQALEAGALAVVPKPPSRDKPTFRHRQRQLAMTLVAMAGVRVVRRWDRPPGLNGNGTGKLIDTEVAKPEILAIGASAGGPGALINFLGGLRDDMPIPIVIVQHMPDEFMTGLSRWLGESTSLPVRVAAHHTILKPGIVYLSPGNAHMKVIRERERLMTCLDSERGNHRYQPSVDVLFDSVAAVCGQKGIGMILTGMGDDGASGLLAMRGAGARTFAQDRASCTVYGMPAAAVERGGVEQVLPLEKLPSAVMKLL